MKITFGLLALFVAIGMSAGAQDTTYNWTGGVSGYAGQIVLDSPSSQGGSLSDIVSIKINTPNFGMLSMNLSAGDVFLTDPIFTWNSSEITRMFIGGQSVNPFDNIVVTENSGGGNDLTAWSILYDTTSIDTSGSWQAVPTIGVSDVASTLWLLGLVLGSLAVSQWLRKLCKVKRLCFDYFV